MIKKLALIALLAYSLFSTNNAFSYDCAHDNKVQVPSDKPYCCCTPVASTTANNDYTCAPQTAKCGQGQIPAGMKINGQKLCPCTIYLE